MANARIETILTAVTASTGAPFRECYFPKPPVNAAAWLTYDDAVETDGPDGINRLCTHTVIISVFESTLSGTVRTALEGALDASGLRWTRGNTYRLETAGRYETDYSITYYEKRTPGQMPTPAPTSEA